MVVQQRSWPSAKRSWPLALAGNRLVGVQSGRAELQVTSQHRPASHSRASAICPTVSLTRCFVSCSQIAVWAPWRSRPTEESAAVHIGDSSGAPYRLAHPLCRTPCGRRMCTRLGSDSMPWTAQVLAPAACSSTACAAAVAQAVPTSGGGADGAERGWGAAPSSARLVCGVRCPLGPAQPGLPPWRRRQRHVLARAVVRAAGAARAAAPPQPRPLGAPDTEGRG